MKKTLAALFVATILVSCGNRYSIQGNFEAVPDSTMVTLNVIDYNGISAIDSAMLMDGKFSLSGKTDSCQLAYIIFETEGEQGVCQLFLEPGKIKVRYDFVSGEQNTVGTPNNDAFQEFYDSTGTLNAKAMELEDKIRITAASNGDAHGFIDEMNALQDEYRALVGKSIIQNSNKIFGYQQLLESYDMFEPEELTEFIDALTPSFGDRPELIQLAQMVSMQMLTATGAPYIDFECSILDQKTQKNNDKATLSSFVSENKVTLLDFWATWCSPCMSEVPYLKAAYEKYASKGFQIVSVSVDEDIDEWKQTISEQGMTWPQMWNGLDDMAASPAMMYSVSAIPSSFLIDAEGTIIGRNLRGEELEAALEDFFK